MLSINVFGLGVPTQVAMLFVAVFAALVTVTIVGRRVPAASDTVWYALLGAAVAARLIFVLRYLDLYLDEPWRIIDIRDGGFDAAAGLFAGLAIAIVRTANQRMTRRPVLAAVVAGMLAWGTVSLTMMLQSSLTPSLPGVVLSTLTDEPITLDDGSGRPVVVNLWATWCPPCRREMPELAAAQQQREDVRFLFVNQGEPTPTIRQYLDGEALTLRNVLRDPFGRVAYEVGSMGLPTTLFYDSNGNMVHSHIGELSPATLERGLQKLAAPAERKRDGGDNP